MLSGISTTGDAFQVGTILRYFGLVVPALIGAFGAITPSRKDTEELVEAYGNMLEMHPMGQKRTNMARGLREFHDFLVRKYGCEIVDVAETFSKEAEVAVVEARIISIDEYYARDAWLRKKALTGVPPKLVNATRLVFMLAFRLGMRRMEIIKLRLCDLHLDGTSDILVRPHPGRRLKSTSSKRRMPLSALLEPDELSRLVEWVNQRIQEGAKNSGSDYLFALTQNELIPVERTVDLIHEAMRAVTGDSDFHLHHLRHSFATWTYLKLRATSHPDLIEVFAHLPHTQKYLQGGHALRKSLLPGGSSPSRSDAYCISRLLGHSGPNVSMNHYIHSSDLLVYGCAKRGISKLEKTIWIGASGLAQRNAYRQINISIDNLLLAVRRKWAERYVIYSDIGQITCDDANRVVPANKSQRIQQEDEDVFAAALKQLWSILHLYDSNIQHEEIAGVLNSQMNKKEIENVIESAKPLALQLGLGLIKNVKRERLTPPKPKQGPEARLQNQLIPSLHALFQKDPAILASGLQIYFEHFNRQKKDVVFKSMKEIDQAKTYLDFLKKMGFDDSKTQLVMRTGSGGSGQLQKWKKILRLPDSVKVKFISPPNSDKDAYSHWLGIQALSSEGGSHHTLIGGIFLLTKIWLEVNGHSMSPMPP